MKKLNVVREVIQEESALDEQSHRNGQSGLKKSHEFELGFDSRALQGINDQDSSHRAPSNKPMSSHTNERHAIHQQVPKIAEMDENSAEEEQKWPIEDMVDNNPGVFEDDDIEKQGES